MKIMNQAKIYIDDYFYYIYSQFIEINDCDHYSNMGRNHWRFGILWNYDNFRFFIFYMTRENTIRKFVLIMANYFNNCRCNYLLVILNQLKPINKKGRGINPMSLSAHCIDYDFNSCRLPPNIDWNLQNRMFRVMMINRFMFFADATNV